MRAGQVPPCHPFAGVRGLDLQGRHNLGTTSGVRRPYGDDGRVRHDDGRTACGRTATTGVRHGGNGGGGEGGGGDEGGATRKAPWVDIGGVLRHVGATVSVTAAKAGAAMGATRAASWVDMEACWYPALP